VWALATVLSQNAASACAPALLISATIKAATLTAAGKTVAAGIVSANAAALTEGVIKAMLLTKLKTVMPVLLVLGMIALGGGLLSRQTALGQQVQPPRDGERPATTAAEPVHKKATETNDEAQHRKVQVTYPVADLIVPIPGL